MKRALFVFILFASSMLDAQEVKLSKSTTSNSSVTYSSVQGSNVTITHTIGQPSLIGSLSLGNFHLYQGFHQPSLQVYNVAQPSISKLIVFPNPSNGQLTVDLSDHADSDELVISLISVEGKFVSKDLIKPSGLTLNLDYSAAPKGAYELIITSDKIHSKSGLLILR